MPIENNRSQGCFMTVLITPAS